MTDPIPLAQFIQARRKLEPPADAGLSQTGGGTAMRVALAEDLTADLSEVLPEQGAH